MWKMFLASLNGNSITYSKLAQKKYLGLKCLGVSAYT